jgi:hypothetical protein
VEKISKYTRNGWGRHETFFRLKVDQLAESQSAELKEIAAATKKSARGITLETSGEDVKLHSKRVGKM